MAVPAPPPNRRRESFSGAMAEHSQAGAVRELMADFGEVMREVQLLEWVLFGMATLPGYTPEQLGTEERHERLEQLYAMTAGQLVQAAQIEDRNLAAQVKSAVNLRNNIVHGWLIYTGLDIVSGKTTIDEQRARLRVAGKSLAVIRQRLQAEHDKAVDELGGQSISGEQLAELWRKDPPSPDDPT
jgi:hypothetical protein